MVSRLHLTLVAALAVTALVLVGAIVLAHRGGAGKTGVVAIEQAPGPQSSARARHALLAVMDRQARLQSSYVAGVVQSPGPQPSAQARHAFLAAQAPLAS